MPDTGLTSFILKMLKMPADERAAALRDPRDLAATFRIPTTTARDYLDMGVGR